MSLPPIPAWGLEYTVAFVDELEIGDVCVGFTSNKMSYWDNWTSVQHRVTQIEGGRYYYDGGQITSSTQECTFLIIPARPRVPLVCSCGRQISRAMAAIGAVHLCR